MSDVEFDDDAAAIADQVRSWPEERRIAAACRGSGNPAALAWLAENLRIGPGTDVADLGAGLGGPAAWLALRYRCPVIASDPAWGSTVGATSLFGLTAVQASAAAAPFRDDAFTIALLLGVVSVVDDPTTVVAEALRVARQLGVLDYCASSGDEVEAGGSHFPSPDRLLAMVRDAGWTVDQSTPLTVPAPDAWSSAAAEVEGTDHPDAIASEAEVIRAIDDGRLAPFMMTATR